MALHVYVREGHTRRGPEAFVPSPPGRCPRIHEEEPPNGSAKLAGRAGICQAIGCQVNTSLIISPLGLGRIESACGHECRRSG
jgi:hypothetical protein